MANLNEDALASDTLLALKAHDEGVKKPQIVVFDAGDVFGATSQTNTACLLYTEMDEGLRAFGEYSSGLWQTLGRQREFREMTGYGGKGLFEVKRGSGGGNREGHKLAPDWIAIEEGWSVEHALGSAPCASTSPESLVVWLVSECKTMGIDIRTFAQVTAVQLDDDERLDSFQYSTPDSRSHHTPCGSVILTTGPWTQQLLDQTLPQLDIKLSFKTDAGDLVLLNNPHTINDRAVSAMWVDDVVDQKLEFAGRRDGTIWACGQRNSTAKLPAVGQRAHPDPELIEGLRDYGRRFISRAEDKDEEVQVVESGRAFRPVTESVVRSLRE